MTDRYFVDTNFFLELQTPDQLPWSELTDADQIALVPSPTVVNEINDHKIKSGRTKRRAISTSATFRKALAADTGSIDLKSSSPRITLELPPTVSPNYDEFPTLDRTVADHRIAAECAVMGNQWPDAKLLSDDTILVIAAREIGVETILVPEGWKLPPENDERDTQIASLKQELSKHQNARPQIDLRVFSADTPDEQALTINPITYAPSGSDISRVAANIFAEHPMATNFHSPPPRLFVSHAPIGMLGSWQQPTEQEIIRYREAYQAWQEDVNQRLTALPPLLTSWSHEVNFTVSITNGGFANARDVRLTITGNNGIMLHHSLDDDELEQREALRSLQPCPSKPTGKYAASATQMFSSLLAAHQLQPTFARDLANFAVHRNKERDPNGFYWVDARPRDACLQLELQCKAYPHQIEAGEFAFRAVVPRSCSNFTGSIKVRIQASNMLQPVVKTIRVDVNTKFGEFTQSLVRIETDKDGEKSR